MRGVRLCVFACALLASLSALAAARVVPSGKVGISHGQGFTEITVPTDATPGESVIARPDSSAKIVYSNGCEVEVAPGTIATVEDHDPVPCKTAAFIPRGGYFLGAAAIGGAAVGICALAGCFGGDSGNTGNGSSAKASSP